MRQTVAYIGWEGAFHSMRRGNGVLSRGATYLTKTTFIQRPLEYRNSTADIVRNCSVLLEKLICRSFLGLKLSFFIVQYNPGVLHCSQNVSAAFEMFLWSLRPQFVHFQVSRYLLTMRMLLSGPYYPTYLSSYSSLSDKRGCLDLAPIHMLYTQSVVALRLWIKCYVSS